jgi:poly-beta-1,6-N-acetyl-D-glucosamine synthase
MTWLFWGSVALIAYTYFGYLGWLWVRRLVWPRPVLRSPEVPSISILMVVRNEEAVLERKLENLLALDYPPERSQLIVVSDGSTDRTAEILRQHAGEARIQVLAKPSPSGKAIGLNDAIALAKAEIVVFTDARQQIEASALRFLMENFADPEVGCASGELMLGDQRASEEVRGIGLYWRIEKKIRELESASGSVMGATGALYAARRELVRPLPPGTILDDVYIPMEVVRQGKRVIFEPRARAWDSPHLGTDREFARKVRTLSGNYQLVQLAPWLLTSHNPARFEFVSHKLLRLIVPLALAATLCASMVLPGRPYREALFLQVLFYGLSLLGGLGLSPGPLSRMADAALTFVMLNSAAAVAFLRFVSGRKAVWTR